MRLGVAVSPPGRKRLSECGARPRDEWPSLKFKVPLIPPLSLSALSISNGEDQLEALLSFQPFLCHLSSQRVENSDQIYRIWLRVGSHEAA